MNILSHIIDSGGLYGAENVVVNLMEEQRKQGFHPKLISIGDIGVAEKAIEVESTRRKIDVKTLRFKNGFNINGASSILSSVEDINAHIIHSHGYKSNILLGLFPRHLRKIPMISTLHGWTSTRFFSKMKLYEYFDALSLKRVDRVIVVSKTMQDHPYLKLFGIRAIVIPNGIPVLAFDEKSCVTAMQPEIVAACKDKLKILAIGRLSPEKGFALLIQTIARLNSSGIDVCLVIIGEGNERSSLLELAKRERIDDKIHLIGYVPDAYRMIPFFDVFALPSYTEGLPITILEAMQGGVPIAATRVGEVPEVLDNGKCGFLVPPGNMPELSEAIETIFRNKQEAKARAEAAQHRVLSEYSVERMTGRYLEEYRQLLKQA